MPKQKSTLSFILGLREHDFNNDSRLDGLEILAAIKHSELGHEMESVSANLTGDALKKAQAAELKDYTSKSILIVNLFEIYQSYIIYLNGCFLYF